MPRAIMTKIDLEARLYKLKTAMYDGQHHEKSEDWKDGYHEALNKVLDILQEWRGWQTCQIYID